MASRGEGLRLRDVARAAGVSEITVSRVIRAKGPIAEETRQRVEAAIRAIGYVPNRLAGALRTTATSELVGVVLPSLNNIVFLDVLRGLNEVLSAGGYRSVISVTEYNPQAECELVRSLLSWRPAAIIVTGRQHEPETEHLLREAKVPVIELMDTDGAPIDIAIGMSHAQAGAEMARHLLGRGYRRFGYVGPDLSKDLRAGARRDAFVETLRAAGAKLLGSETMAGPSPVQGGRDALARLLATHPAVEAVYFSNDDAAIGGLFHCMAEGIEVPGALAIAGFNGLDVGQLMPKPLTTTLTRRFEMGCRAGAAILDRLGGIEVPNTTDLGFELIPGATA